MRDMDLDVAIDAVGNIFGTWTSSSAHQAKPFMIGSHIDTVIDAGIYDGAYGVIAALEVIQALQEAGVHPSSPITVAAFTNEEGVRFTPDMMGSLVFARILRLESALSATDVDGKNVGAELRRIGYAGTDRFDAHRPRAFVELHVEQGPVLQHEGLQIGAVDGVQGISWQRFIVSGEANHAGTTPMSLRRDASYATARMSTFVHDLAVTSNGTTVATVGTMQVKPGAINIIPSEASFTVDLRDNDEQRLGSAENRIAEYAVEVQSELGVRITATRLVRLSPVMFDGGLVRSIERAASERGLRVRRMTSGAGHDAQVISSVMPTAMIFVPSEGGVSHSPREHTEERDLIAGANVLLDVTRRMTDDDTP